MRRAVLALALAAAGLACAGDPAPRPRSAEETAAPPASAAPGVARWQVRILRDRWGIPHVFGRTDADVAYGLAWAHAEDDFPTLQEVMLAVRGGLAAVRGREAATGDYLVHWLGVRDDVEAGYDRDLSPATRALLEGYAAGLNAYAARHPDAVLAADLFPVRGDDVVAGFVLRAPFFYGMDAVLARLFRGDGTAASARTAPPPWERLASVPFASPAFGSNTFAVSPARSADGHARLLVNSHQPWTGPVAWYEAHVRSDEGWEAVGGVFPGSPVILHGHGRELGWAFTVNRPDLVDVYRLELDPADPDRYRLDGAWHALEKEEAALRVRLAGPLRWTVRREVARSRHGPVLRLPHGTFAVRWSGRGEVRQIEQWYRMNRARDLAGWLDAMRMQAIPSLNAGYADRAGHVVYLHNARFPRRAAGFDWAGILPGDTSAAIWTEYEPFEALPLVLDPPAGFVQNCNSSPFETTLGDANPRPDAFPASFGLETRMTNRALRALELLGGDERITADAFRAIKFDVTYSPRSETAAIVREALAALAPRDAGERRALEILAGWDRRADPESRGAALAVLTAWPVMRARREGTPEPAPAASLRAAIRALDGRFGRVDPPWRDVNRLRRGALEVGVAGGPDLLHAVEGEIAGGRVEADSGDGLMYLVAFGPDGVRSEALHQYGSATGNPASPHYADQAPLFAERRTRPVWLDEAEIRANLEREYTPGAP